MRLVLDNNIFFSLMNPKSVNSYIFSLIKAELFAPEFIKSEFNKYEKICLSKSGLSEHEFQIRKKEIEEQINFIKPHEYEKSLEKAKESISDPKDIDFLALAIKINSPIWSNDKHFKEQNIMEALTTSELIDKILNKKI